MKRNDDNHTLCFLEMTFRRCVGHAINVSSVCPTNLTSDVGSGTSASTTLTFLTTTLLKSSLSDNVWIVELIACTLLIATTRGGSPANNLQRYEICVCSSSSSSSSSSSAQLPFVLTLPCASSCCIVLCCCVMPIDEITCSISHLISSLISRLKSSLILASCSCVAGVADEEDRETDLKKCLTFTPNPTMRTWPGCFGMPIDVVSISCFAWLIKLPCELCCTRSSCEK